MEHKSPLLNRRFPRRFFRRGVGILIGGKYFMAQGSEIGEGGLSFRSEIALKVGALIVISFQIPDGNFISVRAEIRNQDKKSGEATYGCAFDSMPFDRKREIRNFVTNRSENEV